MKKLFSICIALLGLTLAVSCNNENNNDEPPVSESLVIEASPRYILADGAQTTHFTVKSNGVDVTSKARIVNYISGGSKTLSTPSFKTSQKGDHIFYAILGGENSPRITVVAATALPDLPTDVMPSKYDFKKRVLLVESTGAWCSNCPYVIKAVHDFVAQPKADDVVIVASHNQDALECPRSIMINNTLNVKGAYPMIFLEMSNDIIRFPEPTWSAEGIRASADKLLKVGTTNGIAISSKVVDGKICVSAEIKVAKAGAFAVGALLLEDNLFLKQANSTPNTEDYFDNHQFVIRAGAPSGQLWEPLGGVAKVAAQTKHTFYCEFDVKDIKKIEDCRVAIFVYDVENKACDNAVEVKVGEQVPYAYI